MFSEDERYQFELCDAAGVERGILPDEDLFGWSATVKSYCGDAPDVVVPAMLRGFPVKAVSWSAFCCRDDLTSVVLPEGVAVLESGTFCGCTRLQRVVLPNSLVTIEPDAFECCPSLTQLTLPKDMRLADIRHAFCDCPGILPASDETA